MPKHLHVLFIKNYSDTKSEHNKQLKIILKTQIFEIKYKNHVTF